MKITLSPEGGVETQPRISVIVPVYNAAGTLPRCLDALAANDYASWELIVVDDGSSDGSTQLAACHAWAPGGAFLLPNPRPNGPAAARNQGALGARGQVLFFIDADVVVRQDTVARIATIFEQNPELSACFGSYDVRPTAPNFLSQYKNLLHCYVHQQGRVEAATFWAGCGAIRRHVFLKSGGFDAAAYARSSVEDIELGARLRRRGSRIRLEKSLQVTHLKRWTVVSLLRSDIADRALPWSRLLLHEGGLPDDLNLRREQRLSALLAWIGVAGLLSAPLLPAAPLLVVGSILGLLVLNCDFYRFLVTERGLAFALCALPWHWLYFLYSSLTFALVFMVEGAIPVSRSFWRTIIGAPIDQR